jgi:hypothetical protein
MVHSIHLERRHHHNKPRKENGTMFQILLTPSAGKRLIAKAILEHKAIQEALHSKTIVIVAGTTNGYVAEELLKSIGQEKGFDRKQFFRGITLPPSFKATEAGRLPDESSFPGDVVIVNGTWQKGKTLFDCVDTLQKGDIIIKGANCIDSNRKRAGILIGHPRGGTIAAAMQAVVGRRVKLIIPVGLEKRVTEDIDTIANLLNSPDSTGPRMFPVSGEILTEIEAIELLFGLKATLVAAGGVCGAEGSIWLAVEGDPHKLTHAKRLLEEIGQEEQFQIA